MYAGETAANQRKGDAASDRFHAACRTYVWNSRLSLMGARHFTGLGGEKAGGKSAMFRFKVGPSYFWAGWVSYGEHTLARRSARRTPSLSDRSAAWRERTSPPDPHAAGIRRHTTA